MASWFGGGGGNAEFDELVDKATSEAIPTDSEDLALSLEICDRIRSKTVPAQAAMRTLKKRIDSRNPNVQLHALKLTDLAVKNGGSHFLAEVTSREFVDNLVSLVRAGSVNGDVQRKALELVQTWGLAFESRPQLFYMTAQYRDLQRAGYDFPPEERLAASFVDTATAPDWADSDVCMRCRSAFTFTNRKHHCRNCGQVFCGQCSSHTMPLNHLGITQPVRVCDGCFNSKFAAAQSADVNRTSAPPGASVQYARPIDSAASRPKERRRRAMEDEAEDMDLKRALEMSLAESQQHRQPPSAAQAYGRNAQASPRKEKPQARIESSRTAASAASAGRPAQNEDDDDGDMKAAIAASLAEMKVADTKRDPYAYPDLSSASTSAAANAHTVPSASQPATYRAEEAAPSVQPPVAAAAAAAKANSHELSVSEAESINLFSTLVDRLIAARSTGQHPRRAGSSSSGGGILADAQVQELYDQVSALRSKMARSLADTVGKYDRLVDTHAKLATVSKYYDRLLEARLGATGDYYGAAPAQGYGAREERQYLPPPQQQQHNAQSYYAEPQDDYYAQQPQPQQQQQQPQRQSYGQASQHELTQGYAPRQGYSNYDTGRHQQPQQQPQQQQQAGYGQPAYQQNQAQPHYQQPPHGQHGQRPGRAQEEASLIDL